ncbi:MAG: YfhO family protein [Conexibacter sp.]
MGSLGEALRRSAAPERPTTSHGGVAQIRRLAEHEHAGAALLLALLVLVYLWPVLIGGDVLSPRGVLFEYPPWASTAPADWPQWTNFLLGDVPMSHYPFHVMARRLLHEGVFPSWSQHAYAGVPFFANPQTLILSPFALPIWILPLELGISVSAALKLWIAGFGTYLLARELRLSFWPGMLAGVSYGLCAFNVMWLTHETLVAVAAILPWSVLLVERLMRGGRPEAAIGLALTTVLVMTGGHPGTQVHVMVATGVYALIRAAAVASLTRRQRAQRLALAGGGMLLGVLLCAVLLLPVLRAGGDTIGVQGRMGLNPDIPGSQLPFGSIRTTIFPDWWGRPSALSTAGPEIYNERTFYTGGIATIFALIALVSAGGWRRKAPFAVLAVIGLAVPLHAPVLLWLATHLPLLRQVQFQRTMLFFEFGIALLAAFGLQRILDAPRERRRALAVVAAGGAVALIALTTASVTSDDLGQAVGNVVRLRHAAGGLLVGPGFDAGGLIASTVLWWIVVVVAVGLLLAALWRWPRRRNVLLVALVGLAAIDLLYFAHDYQPMQPATHITPPRTGSIDYLVRHADDGRFTGLYGAFLNNWLAPLGLRDVRGSEPPQPSLRWYHLWKAELNPDQPDWAQTILPQLPTATGLNALSVMGARYIGVDPGTVRPPRLPRLRVGYAGDDATVFVNPDAVPRAMVAPRVILTSDETDTIRTIDSESFEPRRDVIVERDEPGADALATSSGDGAGVRVVDETTASVPLRATLRQPGLVVLNDALAPGWSVKVDGSPASVIRANDVMRGVAVDKGTHEIVWSYRVPGLRLGAALSALGLVLLMAASAAVVRARRRAPPT